MSCLPVQWPPYPPEPGKVDREITKLLFPIIFSSALLVAIVSDKPVCNETNMISVVFTEKESKVVGKTIILPT